MNVLLRRLSHALGAAALVTLSVQPLALAEDAGPVAEAIVSESPATQSPATQSPGTDATESPTPAPSDQVAADPSAAPSAAANPPAAEAPEAPAAAAPDPVGPTAAVTATGERAQARAQETCTPRDRGDSITDISVSPTIVRPTQTVSVSFTGFMEDGGCDGDFIKIPLPPQLRGFTGTFPVKTADGTEIATMVVNGTDVVMTFNDYLETHSDVRFSGFVLTQVRNTVEPDTTYDLHWPVGEGFDTPITTEPCDNCGLNDVGARKFATFEAGPPPFVRWGISSRVTASANETIVITDSVGAGQRIDCGRLSVKMGNSVNAWGVPQFANTWTDFTVDSCTDTDLQVTINASAAGQFFQLLGRSVVTAAQGAYSDSGTVSQAGVLYGVKATARTSDGGGEVIGILREPKIDIEKWSTDEGKKAGDHDTKPKDLQPNRSERLTFTVKNTGNERLRNIVVRDRTTAGTGTVRGLSCDFSKLGGPSSGTRWAGPFRPGESFTCTGILRLGANATHTNTATVTGTGIYTEDQVRDADVWMGQTPGGRPGPAIDIEKWSTNQGPRAGDHDRTPAQLTVAKAHRITFTVTNTGTEPLRDIAVTDRLIDGVGTLDQVSCDFSRYGGPASGTSWEGPLQPGRKFFCTGVLHGLKAGQHHTNAATVTGVGEGTGAQVRDRDLWKGTTSRVEGSADSGQTPALPATGAQAGLAPLGAVGLVSLATGLFLIRRQRTQRSASE